MYAGCRIALSWKEKLTVNNEKKEKTMKKLIAIFCTLCVMIIPLNALASGPSESYDPTPFTGSGAWSYIKVTPVSGDTARTHYIFSNYTTNTEGKVDTVKDISYNKKKNTLTLNNYKEEDVILEAFNMGTTFKIFLKGKKNRLRSISVTNDNSWESGLKMTGKGFITIGNKTDHNHVPLNVEGKCRLSAGKVKLIAEKPDVGSGLGLRYTLMVKDNKEAKPFSTTMSYSKNVEINTFERASGGAITNSKDTITFTKKK